MFRRFLNPFAVRHWLLALIVFAVCCCALAWNLRRTGIASGPIDPVKQFGAQDEAVYTREAIEMTLHGNWMTPMLLGRPVFEKPPLLIWMMTIAMKLFGISPLTARIPSVLAGSLVCTVCWWVARTRSGIAGGVLAAMLALTSQIVFTMSRHAMTDIVVAAGTIVSLFFLTRDPRLLRFSNAAAFTLSAVACLLVKSVGGLLPLAALAMFSLLGRSDERPTVKRTAAIIACSLAIAGIWFGFSYLNFPDWFLADSKFQIFTVGSGEHQTSRENHVFFYLGRLMYSDALTLVLLLSALYSLAGGLRMRDPFAILMCSYLGVFGTAILLFRFHSEQYLCWFIPLLIVTAVAFSPLAKAYVALALTGLCLVIFAIRVTQWGSRWGVRTEAGTTLTAATLLTNYCKERRAVDLYVLDVDDEFYGMVLPLNSIRYGWIDSSNDAGRQHPYLENLGVLLHVEDMLDSGTPPRSYRDRLRRWGVNSGEAIGTGIMGHDADALGSIVPAKPESDFLISERIWRTLGRNDGHRVAATSGDYILLEAEKGGVLGQPLWRCEM